MSDDPFELLAGMVPHGDPGLAPGEDQDADALLQRVMTLDRGAEPNDARILPFRSRRRAVATATVVAAMLVGGGTVAAVVLLRRPADPSTLVCYSDALIEPAVKVGLQIDPDTTTIEQCASLWSDGTLGRGGTGGLVDCVADEVTVVIPGGSDAICVGLGWQPAGEPLPDEQLSQRVAAAVPELFEGCIEDLGVASDRVERLLADLKASDTWTVTVEGSTSTDRPCAANVVDATTRVVRIIAFKPPTD